MVSRTPMRSNKTPAQNASRGNRTTVLVELVAISGGKKKETDRKKLNLLPHALSTSLMELAHHHSRTSTALLRDEDLGLSHPH